MVDHRPTIKALVAKRAELGAKLVALDRQRKAVRQELVSVDHTLLLFGYEGDPKAIEPHFTRRQNKLFKPGHLHRTVADIVRERSNTVTARDIASMVVIVKAGTVATWH